MTKTEQLIEEEKVAERFILRTLRIGLPMSLQELRDSRGKKSRIKSAAIQRAAWELAYLGRVEFTGDGKLSKLRAIPA